MCNQIISLLQLENIQKNHLTNLLTEITNYITNKIYWLKESPYKQNIVRKVNF